MAKIKGWTKLDDLVYRSDRKDLFGNYRYMWVDSRNRIRGFDTIRKVDKLHLPMIKHSYIYHTSTSEITAKKYMFELLRGFN